VSKAVLTKTDDKFSVELQVNPALSSLQGTVGSRDKRLAAATGSKKLTKAFTTAQWAAVFKISVRQAQDDLQKGREANPALVWQDGENYVLVPVPDDEMVRILKEKINSAGRKSTQLFGKKRPKAFGVKEVQAFALEQKDSLPPLPKDLAKLLPKVMEALAEEVEEVTKGQKWVFRPVPAQRDLPKKWDATTVRNRFYINGSEYTKNRDEVRDAGIAKIQAALDKIHSDDKNLQKEGKAAFANLYESLVTAPEYTGPIGPSPKAKTFDAKFLDYEKMTADHITAVADHWTTDGHKITWGERQKWVALKKNLQPMHDKYNKSKNAKEEYHNTPAAKSFTGPGETKGVWWADEETPFENAPDGIKDEA
jgi:hypothetical protein